MGKTIKMRSTLVLFCFIFYTQCDELVVKGEAVDRFFCCNQVQSRCNLACAGQDCSRTCSGMCGIFGTRCGPWTCSALQPGTCTAAPVPAPVPVPAPAPVPVAAPAPEAAPVPAPLPPINVGGK